MARENTYQYIAWRTRRSVLKHPPTETSSLLLIVVLFLPFQMYSRAVLQRDEMDNILCCYKRVLFKPRNVMLWLTVRGYSVPQNI